MCFAWAYFCCLACQCDLFTHKLLLNTIHLKKKKTTHSMPVCQCNVLHTWKNGITTQWLKLLLCTVSKVRINHRKCQLPSFWLEYFSKQCISMKVTGFIISRKQCVILVTHSCTFSLSPVLCALGFPPVIIVLSSLNNNNNCSGTVAACQGRKLTFKDNSV